MNAIVCSLPILSLLAISWVACAGAPTDKTETFVWKHRTRVIGRLLVPQKFSVEVYDYREGIVTTLRYKNGAKIVLQAGGMYRIPMFQGPEYKLSSSTDQSLKKVRLGLIANLELNWREDNYKLGKPDGKRYAFLAASPLNIGYENVSFQERAAFDKAIDSFLREFERPLQRSK